MVVTVLVCSPDTRKRNRITSLLQQMGLTIVGEASDGPQALRLTRSSRPNIVVVDVELYQYSELEAALIIAKEKLAPVILVTSPHHREVIDAIEEHYIMSYVVKPVNKWSMESSIRTALANFRKMEQLELEINKLKETLETRKLVERAKHILMRDLKLSEPEAFRRLQKQSMDKGIPMKALAEAIILNDELKGPQ